MFIHAPGFPSLPTFAISALVPFTIYRQDWVLSLSNHAMPDSPGGHRMPGDLRRNRLEIPPCPECEGPDSTVVERGERTLTLECPACGCQFEVEKPGQS
jgi:hypothetical protein